MENLLKMIYRTLGFTLLLAILFFAWKTNFASADKKSNTTKATVAGNDFLEIYSANGIDKGNMNWDDLRRMVITGINWTAIDVTTGGNSWDATDIIDP